MTGRQAGLIPIVGLAVGYVRHGLATQWASWVSVEQFFGYWFIHTVALLLFTVISGAVILHTHEFFLGEKPKYDIEDVIFNVVMTVLLAVVAIYFVAHWTPTGNDED